MKKWLPGICLCVLWTHADAQFVQRIIGAHYRVYDGNTLVPTDSAVIKYAGGNYAAGDAVDFEAETLPCDTIRGYRYDGSTYQPAYEKINYGTGGWDTTVDKVVVNGAMTNSRMVVWYHSGYIMDTITTFSWQNNAWLPVGRHLKTYTSGMLMEDIEQQFASGGWVHKNRITYVYNNFKLLQVNYQYYDALSTGWKEQRQTVYTYNTANNNDSIIQRNWDGAAGTYADMYLQAMTYGPLNKVLTSEIHTSNGSGWQLDSRTVMTYDIFHATIAFDTTYTYDAVAAALQPSNAVRYHANSDGHIDTFYTVYWLNGNLQPDSTCMAMTMKQAGEIVTRYATVWDEHTSSWVATQHDLFHYETLTGISKLNSNIAGIRLYPNPAGSFVNVDVKMERQQPYTVSIYNTTGSLLRQWEEKGSNSRMISTTDLQAGNYIVTIRSGSDVQSAQFVIAR